MTIDKNKILQFTVILLIPFLVAFLEKTYSSDNAVNTTPQPKQQKKEEPVINNTNIKSGFNITVNIYNIEKGDNVKVGIFNNNTDFPFNYTKALLSFSQTIYNENNIIHTFENVKEGRYAIIVFIDKNNNNKLDTDIFGIPKERYGLSLNTYAGFKIPSFYDCSFVLLNDVGLAINIK